MKGGGISFFGYLIQAVMNVLFQWYMARTLGASGVGIYTLAFSVITLALLFATLGLERGIIKFVAHYQALQQPGKSKGVVVAAFWIYGGFSLIVSLGLFLGADWINQRFFQEPALTQVLQWMTLLLLANGWIALLVSVPVGFRRVDIQATVQQIFLPVASLALAVLFVFGLGAQLMAFVYAALIAGGLAALIALWRLWRFPPWQRLRTEGAEFELRKLLGFSAPLFFTQLLNRTEGQLSFLFLGALAAMADVGVYRVGSRLTLPMTMMLSALLPIFSPIISLLYAKGEMAELERLYRTTTRWLLTAGLPVFLILILIPGELLGLFGDEFTAAAGVLRLIALAQLVNIATGPVAMILQMTRYVSLNLLNAVVALAVTLLLQYWLIPIYGLMGAALADMVGISLLNLLRLGQVFLLLRIHPWHAAFLKPLAAASIAALAGWGLLHTLSGGPALRMGAALLAVLSVYPLALWILKFDPADRALLATGRRAILRRAE